MIKQQITEDITFYNDNCFNVFPLIPDKSVDCIFADLPFNTTKCSWDQALDLDKLWLEYNRIIKDNGVILLFGQPPFDKILGCSNLKMLRYEWIWEKTSATGHQNAKKMPMKAHENILVFYKKLPTYNPQKTTGHKRKVSKAEHKINSKESEVYNKNTKLTSYDSTERYPRSVLKFASDKQKSKLHPTQKPLALIEYFIKTYTNEGDMVLDNVAGSFTTAVGCDNLKRKCVAIELLEKYYNVGIERLENNKNGKIRKNT
jgi:DNA modification methylase